MTELFNWILESVQSVDPMWRAVLAGLGIMLETSIPVGLVVPGDTIVVPAATGVASVPEAIWLGVAVDPPSDPTIQRSPEPTR
ncbi:hypothetical protein [Millisia brevis]|uniref:hypothetical protein n=1 Tax=Millisia brevis TaxID=264148 RepID=UPI00082C70C5|nr:hypothetical protein [Millisia brevis]